MPALGPPGLGSLALSEVQEPEWPGLPGDLPVEAAGNGCLELCRSHGICYMGVIPSWQRKPYLLLNSLQKKKSKKKKGSA